MNIIYLAPTTRPPAGGPNRCRASRSARGWCPRSIRPRSTIYPRAPNRAAAPLASRTRPPALFACRCASHRSTFASRSLHPGGESVLLACRMAAGVEWMAPDARAAARGLAADARERKGGMAFERRSAVVGHRRPTAAGCDVRTRVWQAVEARLPARHGRCAAGQRARSPDAAVAASAASAARRRCT